MKVPLQRQVSYTSKFLLTAFTIHALSFSPAFASTERIASKSSDLPYFAINRCDITWQGVVAESSGEPLPGVTVSIPGTGIRTATDLAGRYSLPVPEGSTLVFSFIGLQSQSIVVGN